jgi:hypothetical protein
VIVFDDIVRTNATPCRHNERRSDFLNRSASKYFEYVRDLIEEWMEHVPRDARQDLRGALRADDRQFDAAFWELYLHEAYRRSGYAITIQPEVAGVSTRPDFLMVGESQRFYLEAVSVGRDASAVSTDRRLDDVHQVLTDLQVENFVLELSTYAVGAKPLATRKLRRSLRTWLDQLDADLVAELVEATGTGGFDRLPRLPWEDDGWFLEFHALPLKAEARRKPRSALGMLGPGEAQVVDNVTGLLRALDSKKSRYGTLDAPLVLAVLSNTEYPTRDYEVEQALYGESIFRPQERALHPESIFRDGFWLTKAGWRHRSVPQIVTIAGLTPWSVTKVQPRLWQTLEPAVPTCDQPEWLARVDLTVEARPLPARTMAACLGLPQFWPTRGDPDFDLRTGR